MCAKYSLPPFDWLKLSHHLVSGESTLHEVTLFEARSRIFLPINPVLRGSILLPRRYPSVFARMARWQSCIPSGAPNENIVQNNLNIASLNVF